MTLPTIAALLGHRGNGVTAGYVGRVDSVLLAAADRLADEIASLMGEPTESAEVIELRPKTAAS